MASLARPCGKGERAETRGKRGRNEEDELEACVAILLDV